ncbi:hypothetical protein WKI68_43840 [Streptomyces sp. MS1.HAVA.3]|uniref:Uncharacterized protein n=1 Tax=Streptomyces caledonius TaxID=3134107 RepID=A0ABU8UEJ2_9ACTN
MLLYAQTPARRTRQILADLIAVVLVAAAVKFALAVHDAIMLLAEPGARWRAPAKASPPPSMTPATQPRRCRLSATS